MSLKIALGVVSCPDCGGMLHYSGVGEIEIYDAQCLNCHKKWRFVKYPDGRREIREKTTS
jgi:hypothetical protein